MNVTSPEPPTQLQVDEAVPLAHALVSHVAARAAIRVLFIKGPVSSAYDLRPYRRSSDVDVWVEPARRPQLLRLMGSVGWVARSEPQPIRILPQHAIHLVNPSWPCDIDVHDQYPGLFASPSDTFEALWSRRMPVLVAGREIQTPGLLGSSIISAAHALRDPFKPQSKSELDHLEQRVRTLSPLEKRELTELISLVRANETLRPFTRRIGLPAAPNDLSKRERRIWALRVSDPTLTVRWIVYLGQSRAVRTPRGIYRMLIPSRDEMVLRNPDLGSGALALWVARISRISKATRSLASAARNYLQLHRKF